MIFGVRYPPGPVIKLVRFPLSPSEDRRLSGHPSPVAREE
jgi:hypothetical protein